MNSRDKKHLFRTLGNLETCPYLPLESDFKDYVFPSWWVNEGKTSRTCVIGPSNSGKSSFLLMLLYSGVLPFDSLVYVTENVNGDVAKAFLKFFEQTLKKVKDPLLLGEYKKDWKQKGCMHTLAVMNGETFLQWSGKLHTVTPKFLLGGVIRLHHSIYIFDDNDKIIAGVITRVYQEGRGRGISPFTLIQNFTKEGFSHYARSQCDGKWIVGMPRKNVNDKKKWLSESGVSPRILETLETLVQFYYLHINCDTGVISLLKRPKDADAAKLPPTEMEKRVIELAERLVSGSGPGLILPTGSIDFF